MTATCSTEINPDEPEEVSVESEVAGSVAAESPAVEGGVVIHIVGGGVGFNVVENCVGFNVVGSWVGFNDVGRGVGSTASVEEELPLSARAMKSSSPLAVSYHLQSTNPPAYMMPAGPEANPLMYPFVDVPS